MKKLSGVQFEIDIQVFCRRSATVEGSAEPGLQAEVLSSIPMPAGNGPVRWLLQAPSRSAESEAASITLLGWMASKDRCKLLQKCHA